VSTQQDLKDVLRLSKIVDGHPVSARSDRVITEADVDAIAARTVHALKDELRDSINSLIWEGIRKLVITGIVSLFAFEQLVRFFK
jgi:hypothetical protein